MNCLSRASIRGALVAAMLLCGGNAFAQRLGEAVPTGEVPNLHLIDVDEKLGDQLPLDLEFLDHTGREVRLGDYFDGERPVLLTFAYHSCPTLCSLVLDATIGGVQSLDWRAGQEYQMVTISIDPRDTVEAAAQKRSEILERLGHDNVEWHFLVTDDEDTIKEAADAAGYRYFYNSAQEQYAHPAAILTLTPNGHFARYLYGLQLNPSDVRLGLLEASEGRSISTTDRFLLYCYAYDPAAQTYGLMAKRVMALGGGLTVLVLGAFLTVLWRRERRRKSGLTQAPPKQSSRSASTAAQQVEA